MKGKTIKTTVLGVALIVFGVFAIYEVRSAPAPGGSNGMGMGIGVGAPGAGGGGRAPGELPPGLANRDQLPPGLAKREQLPPGLQKQIERRGQLPPGLQGEALPQQLEERLSVLPKGYSRVRVGADIVLLEQNTRIMVDVIKSIAID